MEEELLELDFKSDNICRVCLLHHNNLSTIFSKCIVDCNILSFTKVFEFAVDLKVSEDDGLPCNVCAECKSKLIQSYIIKQKCLNSFKLLSRLCEQRLGNFSTRNHENLTRNHENLEDPIEEDPLNDEPDTLELIPVDEEDSKSVESQIKQENIETNCKVEYVFGEDAIATDSDEQVEIIVYEAQEPAPTLDELFCAACKTYFKDSETYGQHNAAHKALDSLILGSQRFYRCGFCHTVFSDKSKWRKHLKNVEECQLNLSLLDENCTDYQILETQKGFEVSLEVDLLISSCRQVNGSFTCDYCDEFQTKCLASVEDHINQVHFKRQKNKTMVQPSNQPHQCSACNLIFAHLHHTVKHVYYVHSTEYWCPFPKCGVKYTTSPKLLKHIEQFHAADMNDKETDPYFVRKLWSKAKQSNLVCEYCNRAFKQSGDLNVHRRLHTGERPYKCHICDKTFRTVGNRSDHMSTHVKEKKFQCEICKVKFKSLRILKSHIVLHNGVKNHSCPECGKKFSRKQHVNIHMKVHTKLKSDLQESEAV